MRCLGPMPVLTPLIMSGQVFRLREDVVSPGLKLQTTEDYCMFSRTVAVASWFICVTQITEKKSLGLMVVLPSRNGKDEH